MLTLRGARLFDGRELVSPPVLTIDAGAIAAVGVEPHRSDEVIELDDVTLLPGLVDTHQHLCFDGNGTLEEQVAGMSDEELRDRARAHAVRALRAGITTIRDLGDRGFVTLDLRGEPGLPTILASGPPITAEGGHCWFLGGCCASTDDLVAAVHERQRRGCEVVKIMVTGGALTPTFPMWESQFTAADVRTVVDTAHSLGLPVAAHCHGVEGIGLAVDAGVDTIEHCTFFTSSGRSELDAELIARIAEAGIVVSATLGRVAEAVLPPFVTANRPTIFDGFRALRSHGGTIVAGTDAGITPAKPHDVLPRAALDLAVLGFAPDEVLRTLTATAAETIGVGGSKGRLTPGYDADVLAVAGDPVRDPEALGAVVGVWRAGRRVVG